MQPDWKEFLQASLDQRERSGLKRTRGVQHLADGVVDFGSNDYLGLRHHPDVVQSLYQHALVGSGASPVLAGYTQHHADLESTLAALNHMEDALVFSSGFACHSGAIACLVGPEDLILSDQLNHASLIDGCRLSKADVQIFPHNDVTVLEQFLSANRHRYGRVLVVTESIFSMDGDAAPLQAILGVCQSFATQLAVDEAHALGVFGVRGTGLVEELGLPTDSLIKLGTLSKAVGVIGGYVCGPRLLTNYLVNFCRSYIYSTAPPIPIVSACRTSIDLLQGMEAERRQLRQTSVSLRQTLRDMGWKVPMGDSPIIPILVGTADRVVTISRRLRDRGLHVPAIRPPTVPQGTARLRLSLSIRHQPDELQRLVDCLSDIAEGTPHFSRSSAERA